MLCAMRTIPALALLACLAPLLIAASMPRAAETPTPEPEHKRVREAVERGEMVSLADLITDAQRRHPGRILEVELEGSEYEIEILTDEGVVMELEYDATTGELLEIEVEND